MTEPQYGKHLRTELPQKCVALSLEAARGGLGYCVTYIIPMSFTFPSVQSVVLNLKTTCFSLTSESETCLGMEPGEGSQHEEQTQESRPCCSPMAGQTHPPSLRGAAGRDRTGEPRRGADAAGALHAPRSEAAGTSSGPHSPESACEGGRRLPPAQTEGCQDVAEIGDTAEDLAVFLSSESGIEPLTARGPDHTPPALLSEGQYSQTPGEEPQPPQEHASEAWPTDLLEKDELNGLRQPALTGTDGKPQGHAGAEGSGRGPRENSQASDLSAEPSEVYMAPEGKGTEEEQINKETEDYLNSLLEGCLKDTEDSLSYEEDDSDLLPDLSPDEASYSLQENLPPDECCLSLDDLAKRIEIAEVTLRLHITKSKMEKAHI